MCFKRGWAIVEGIRTWTSTSSRCFNIVIHSRIRFSCTGATRFHLSANLTLSWLFCSCLGRCGHFVFFSWSVGFLWIAQIALRCFCWWFGTLQIKITYLFGYIVCAKHSYQPKKWVNSISWLNGNYTWCLIAKGFVFVDPMTVALKVGRMSVFKLVIHEWGEGAVTRKS